MRKVITCFGDIFYNVDAGFLNVFLCNVCVSMCVCVMGNTRVCRENRGFRVWNLLLASYSSMEAKKNTR